MNDLINGLIQLLLWLFGEWYRWFPSLLILTLLLIYQSQREHQQKPQKTLDIGYKPSSNQVSWALKRQVYGMADKETVERTLRACRGANPGKPEQWYWETVLWELGKASPPQSSGPLPPLRSLKKTAPAAPRQTGGPVKWETQAKVQNLVKDRGAIDRLLNHARLNNPGRTDQWYWEKVLWDLERDRRV